ncbi:hypothetical protein K438DRAFT_1292759 [Mycena galopus ATCC 62051]|nr:hypothetical protein K438DRAFT_1292759 [Mycena galopus ATCC 62051]
MVPRLLRLLLKQEDLVASPFSLLFSPSPPNACSPYFAELKASYANSGDLMPNPSQLEKIRLIVTTLHESHEWAYSSLVFVGLFVQRGLDLASFDHTDQPHASFEPKRTCYTILSEIESNPPRRLVTEHTLTSFPPGIQKLEFWWSSPREIDVLAQIVFRMFGFFADCQIDTYLGERRDTGAIEYALKDCDPVALARRLASDLLNQGDHSLWGHRTILQITTVANCVNPDSVAIHFIDEVLAHGPPVISRQSAIMAIRYLRCLRQLLRELFDMVVSSLPESTFFPRLQQICQGELLRPLSPMFLPPDVNIGSVITSLRIHLLNNYISFLSDFFQNMIPAEARSTISPFNLPFNLPSSMHWTDIDHEIQNGFFAAILAHTQSLAHPQSLMSSSTRAMDADLWASDLFWINYHWEGPGPSVHGILPTCLELLRESLELYHATAKTWSEDGAEIDTTSSRRLLEEVKKTLERTGPASGASTAQGGELPEPQRTDIDEAISVEHADSVSANWASF